MKIFRSLYAAIALAAIACLTACDFAVSCVAATHRRVKDGLTDFAVATRLARRERPELTGSWRMCPST